MKTIVFGLVAISALLITPAYAVECGGGEFEPFTNAEKNTMYDAINVWNRFFTD